MSVWYHYNVRAIGVDRRAVANFFSLPKEDVYSDDFELSFGGKNGACLPLHSLIKDHPDIIWLVEQQIETETYNYWIERYDNIVGEHQRIMIESSGFSSHDINKRLMEEYDQAFPGLVAKHVAGEKGYETFRWSYFFSNFGAAAAKLRRAADYEEMVTLITNDDFVDNDYSHLELEDD
jgi:hypothetical protein